MITFKKDTTLTIVESVDEFTDTVDGVTDTFKSGELVDADITSEENGICDIQYGDGSISTGIPRTDFEVLEDWKSRNK